MEDDDHVNDPFSSMFPKCSEDSAKPISYCLPRPWSTSTITVDFPFMSPTIHDDDANSPILSLLPEVSENPSIPTLSLFPELSGNPSELTLSLFPQVSENHSLSLFPQVSDNTTTQSSAPPLSTDLCLSLPYTPDTISSTTLTLQCSNGSHPSSAKRSLFQESREEVPVKKLKVTKESRNNLKGQRSIIQPAAEPAEGEEGQWIMKTLKMSDVNGASRLLLCRQDVKKYVLPFMDEEQQAIICNGINVTVYDMDTDTEHILTLKKWATNSFILVKAWTAEFVKRRNLKEGDIISMRWEKNNSRFCFRVHRRNQEVGV